MLEEMKQTLASGKSKPFKIGYLTADRHRKSGGQYRMAHAVLSTKGKKSGSTTNRTINIQHVNTQEFQSIHYDNILYFNGKSVS